MCVEDQPDVVRQWRRVSESVLHWISTETHIFLYKIQSSRFVRPVRPLVNIIYLLCETTFRSQVNIFGNNHEHDDNFSREFD